MSKAVGGLARLLRRVESSVLLVVLVVMVVVRGRGFNVGRIYDRAAGFIERSAKERRLSR